MATENGNAPLVSPQAPPPKPEPEPEKLLSLRIYQHSNFFYWWVVWAYGFFCAILTGVAGHKVAAANTFAREPHFYPDAWLGVSFVAVLLVVAFFTNYRLKGAASFIAILIIALTVLTISYLGGWPYIIEALPHLLIYMNLAFYVSLSAVLFVLWLLATFVLDSLTYWEFTPGQVTKRHVVGQGAETFDAHGLSVVRDADDILINKVFGLWFIGYGTADLKFTTAGAVREHFSIENVWRASRRERQIQEIAVVRPNTAT
jgi:hypothetical protein